MDLLANYDDGSNTPKTERHGEDANSNMAAEYERMMNALESDGEDNDNTNTSKAPSPETIAESLPWLAKKGSDASSSHSDSSDDDSGSEDEENKKNEGERKGSESTDYSSDDSSASGDSKQEMDEVKAPEPVSAPKPVVEKDSRTSSSNHKVSRKRSRSRSRSKERKHRHSSDKRRRSSSRSKDRRHRHHRSDRRASHRSRSRSKDRHSRRRSSKDRRRKDGHRSKPGGSREAHRRRHRHSSSHRRRHRSRSDDRKKSRSDKAHKSRSRSPSKKEEKHDEPGGVRPAPFRTTFGRGRGNPNGFKEQLRKEFIQNCSAIQTAVSANPNQVTMVPPLMKSSCATTSAGLGVNMGGLTSAILNQMQQAHKMAGQPLPGGLTQEQMMINQRAILQATGRTREQVEAETGMKVPEYYNEVNFNVKEWAEREKKRKMLFKKKTVEVEPKANQFSAKALLPGADQAQAEKFSRLLGVKKHQERKAGNSPEQEVQAEVKEAERQNHLLEDLSKSYDSARVYTHLARGSGLGYSNTMYQPLG